MNCYFFGTFNPIHKGHIEIARRVKELKGYERVIFVPCYIPPHKHDELISFNHRYNMAVLAIGEDNVSDIESKLKVPSYTYRTIQKLYENNNNQISNANESESNGENIKKKSSMIETKGKWGKRKGDTYKFSKGIKSLNKTPVYPQLLYKKSQEKSDDNNKKIIILKLVGQDQTVEFFKDDLYKNFGRTIKRKGRGGRSHSIWCNDDEFQI